MASTNNSTRKRTPDSNVDDSSGVPIPKRTRDKNCNVEDMNDQEEEVIQSLKENPGSALALTKLLSCDACKAFARAPIRNCGLRSGLRHTICSACFTDGGTKCPIKDCTGFMHETIVNEKLTSTFQAMNLSVQCKNHKNGCPKKGKEKDVEEHEIECEYRRIIIMEHHTMMFKDILSGMKAQVEKNDRKWKIFNSKKASRYSFEPDGHIFRIYLSIEGNLFKAYTTVFGGENVAKKYRVELRLSSCEKEFTHTHHGPVFSLDVQQIKLREEAFIIDKKRFALFNQGFDHFGDHNKDKNGEIIFPLMVKIIKKELDIPKED